MPVVDQLRGRATVISALAVALVAIGGVLSLPSPQFAAASNRPLQTGVSYVNETEPVTFANVRRTGARLVGTVVRWHLIAPSAEPSTWDPRDPGDPHYDWAWLDAWVRGSAAAGLTPLLVIGRAPDWAQRCPAVKGGPVCRPDPADLADFAVAAARRYSGEFGGLPRVRFWQGLNEPNLSLFFAPQFGRGGRLLSPGIYRELINTFYFAIKSVDRSNLVLAAGLGPIAVPGLTIGPMRFARSLLCMRGRRNPRPTPGRCGGGVHFDIFDIHPYTTGGPSHRGKVDDVQIGDLGKLQALLRAADRAGRIKGAFRRTPLWVTEFSWDSNPPDPGGLPMPILRRWTAEALHTAWLAGVSRFFWFSLRDQAPDPSRPFSETGETGLYFRGSTPAGDRPKGHLSAFRFPFVGYARGGGLQFWGRTPDSRAGRVAIQLRRGGGWRTVAVARAERNGIFQGRSIVAGQPLRRSGLVRARYRGEHSPPFSLRPVRDFHQPPFG